MTDSAATPHEPSAAVDAPPSNSKPAEPSTAAEPSVLADDARSSKSRERERERGGRERDARHRSSRDRDSERSSHHHRSSRDRDRDRDRDRERDRPRDRDGRDGKRSRHSRSRSRSPARSSRTHSSRAQRTSRSRSPPPAPSRPAERGEDAEREKAERTVFVSQIHPKVSERELFDFFSSAGRVQDVRLIKDKATKRSKGLAYVELRDRDDAAKAVALSGQLLAGYPVTVQQTQYPPSREQPMFSADSLRLYVGSLQYQITEADLRPIFAAFGPIDSIEVHKDSATGISKGFGFVQYAHRADAEVALRALQGVEVGGRPMKLGLATQAGSGMTNFPPLNALLTGASLSSSFPSLPGSAAALPPAQPPSPCLRIANMFDPREETEPEWDADIAEEMREEGGKHGRLLQVHVDKNSQGHVYLRFASIDSAAAAVAALNGRWFGGRQLAANFITETQMPQS